MKDYELPISCSTVDKIKRGLKWTVLIGFSAIPFVGMYYEHIPTIAIGVMVTFGIWTGQILEWGRNDKLPSFHCRRCTED